MDNKNHNQALKVALDRDEPGFPCFCRCDPYGCPTRHYHVDIDLCDTCLEHSQGGSPNHGEGET